ncbi:unnamed protein product [Mycena citricolor]|uniref:Uncharacterized protein n=1 Tax=Mycena citricolor TaxID=2018698 RepID=A0AAD2K157_9AGAR|nr:unnamed protein product [Mycena citricolor]
MLPPRCVCNISLSIAMIPVESTTLSRSGRSSLSTSAMTRARIST